MTKTDAAPRIDADAAVARIIANVMTTLEYVSKHPETASLTRSCLDEMSISPAVIGNISNLLDFVAKNGLYGDRHAVGPSGQETAFKRVAGRA